MFHGVALETQEDIFMSIGNHANVNTYRSGTTTARMAIITQVTRSCVVLVMVAVLNALVIGVNHTAAAAPAPAKFPAGQFRSVYVRAPGNMPPVKVHIYFANNQSRKAVYMLDGLRARYDRNGWDLETNARELAKHGVNVIMPVGGTASFYTNWHSPNNFTGQTYAPQWETFLTSNLPTYLWKTYRIERTNNAIVGVSMGGNAALVLAAYYPRQFRFAGALSGYNYLSAPLMPEAVRAAMLDAGLFNADSMWGPPWDPAWRRNDPFCLYIIMD